MVRHSILEILFFLALAVEREEGDIPQQAA